jgi:nucleotidyltransferase-like protein
LYTVNEVQECLYTKNSDIRCTRVVVSRIWGTKVFVSHKTRNMSDKGNDMVPRNDIEAFSRQVVDTFSPQRIVLFGSHADGTATEGSDVDILVVMPFEGKSVRVSLDIIRRTRPRFPVDILVRSPVELQQRLVWDDYFLREIVEKGEVLYDAAGE